MSENETRYTFHPQFEPRLDSRSISQNGVCLSNLLNTPSLAKWQFGTSNWPKRLIVKGRIHEKKFHTTTGEGIYKKKFFQGSYKGEPLNGNFKKYSNGSPTQSNQSNHKGFEQINGFDNDDDDNDQDINTVYSCHVDVEVEANLSGFDSTELPNGEAKLIYYPKEYENEDKDSLQIRKILETSTFTRERKLYPVTPYSKVLSENGKDDNNNDDTLKTSCEYTTTSSNDPVYFTYPDGTLKLKGGSQSDVSFSMAFSEHVSKANT
ncbi:uncharacterized protein L201_003457 [Kwoniella dendrophila CBS 6074]|uniref:Uncharacterized protein n=1 Tax=Kwoniella dendrophila CBS 6074 TaxID=1295534 RepID=A0AAX4JSY1_9TREE